jgi:hypothetical protein
VFLWRSDIPEKSRGFYKNDVSKELLNTAMQASKDFFNGKHFNNATTGEGLKSYLDYVKAVRSGQQLSTIIDNQFAASLNCKYYIKR